MVRMTKRSVSYTSKILHLVLDLYLKHRNWSAAGLRDVIKRNINIPYKTTWLNNESVIKTGNNDEIEGHGGKIFKLEDSGALWSRIIK